MARTTSDSDTVYRSWIELERLDGIHFKIFWGPYATSAPACSIRNSEVKKLSRMLIDSGVQKGTVTWEDGKEENVSHS